MSMKPEARRPDQAAELDVDVAEDDVDDEEDEDVEEADEEEESDDEDESDDDDDEDDELELSLFAADLPEPPLVLLEEERLSFR
ncbi:hypothetical protein SMALA_4683 [Streptomyces malaysiensis subsp. malaysiensis]|nr:hypothetical protein SMALA_4683 [Streptomyces malaysiensis]